MADIPFPDPISARLHLTNSSAGVHSEPADRLADSGRAGRRAGGWVGGWVDGWMDGWMDGWVSGWTGWMDGWKDGWLLRGHKRNWWLSCLTAWLPGCLAAWLRVFLACWLLSWSVGWPTTEASWGHNHARRLYGKSYGAATTSPNDFWAHTRQKRNAVKDETRSNPWRVSIWDEKADRIWISRGSKRPYWEIQKSVRIPHQTICSRHAKPK